MKTPRKAIFQIRLHPHELERIKIDAQASGINASAYARKLLCSSNAKKK
jgi:predicted DNA binding CopG/RHH family protein